MEKLEKEFYKAPEAYVVRVAHEMPLCHLQRITITEAWTRLRLLGI